MFAPKDFIRFLPKARSCKYVLIRAIRGSFSPLSAGCVLISHSFERSASPYVASAMLLNKVVFVVVKNIP